MPADLFAAAQEGDLEALRALVTDARTANRRGPERWTPLMAAAAGGHVEAVRLLLERGAEPGRRNADGHDALLIALCQGEDEAARLLLDAGAAVDDADHLPLDFAVRFATAEMVRLLLERGAPEGSVLTGLLPEAVARGDGETARLLVERGANPRKATHGSTPLVVAIHARKPELVEWLLELGVPLTGALGAAVQSRNLRLAARLLALGADPGERDALGDTPLQAAAESGRVFLLRRLIAAGVKLEARGGMLGQTALHRAATRGKHATVRALLAAGAKPDVTDDFGESPLQEAAAGGDARMVEILLRGGARPDRHQKGNPAPLHAAVAAGHQETARLLLERGADANLALGPTAASQLDAAPGATPLHLAAATGRADLVSLLLDHGADPARTDARGRPPADLAALAGHRGALAQLRSTGAPLGVAPGVAANAALHSAAAEGDVAAVREALAAGADPEARESTTGYPPLLTAALAGHAEVVALLLKHGARPAGRRREPLTPLRAAVVRGHAPVVRLLLAAGADPNRTYEEASVPADEGYVIPSAGCPLADAAAQGSEEILDLLLAAGADPDAATEPSPVVAAVRERQFHLARRLLAAGARRREADADVLGVLEWEERAAEPAFGALAAELEGRCGPPESASLPGVRFFRFTAEQQLPELGGAGDPIRAGREWGRAFHANQEALSRAVGDVQADLGERVRAAGYLLLDAGSPLGCGPMTRFLALVPENDPFVVMAAWGVRANDDERPTAELIGLFRGLHAEEPWDLLGIRFDTLTIRFRRTPPDPTALARRLRRWCSDLGEARSVAAGLRATQSVHFWWD